MARRAMDHLAAAGFGPFKISVVVTRHQRARARPFEALADGYGAQLRLTRLRPSGRGADVWHDLHLRADQQGELYHWLVDRPGVLTGDSFFHLTALGEALPGLNLCGAGRVVCLIDPVGDVYACPFVLHPEFRAGSVRDAGGFTRCLAAQRPVPLAAGAAVARCLRRLRQLRRLPGRLHGRQVLHRPAPRRARPRVRAGPRRAGAGGSPPASTPPGPDHGARPGPAPARWPVALGPTRRDEPTAVAGLRHRLLMSLLDPLALGARPPATGWCSGRTRPTWAAAGPLRPPRRLLPRRAEGGAGVIVVEEASVHPATGPTSAAPWPPTAPRLGGHRGGVPRRRRVAGGAAAGPRARAGGRDRAPTARPPAGRRRGCPRSTPARCPSGWRRPTSPRSSPASAPPPGWPSRRLRRGGGQRRPAQPGAPVPVGPDQPADDEWGTDKLRFAREVLDGGPGRRRWRRGGPAAVVRRAGPGPASRPRRGRGGARALAPWCTTSRSCGARSTRPRPPGPTATWRRASTSTSPARSSRLPAEVVVVSPRARSSTSAWPTGRGRGRCVRRRWR